MIRPSGRFVNLATNWDALFWSGGDPDLTARLLSVWDRHAPHPNLPVQLPSMLRAHGFGNVVQRPVPMINRRFHENSFAWWGSQLIAAFVLGTGEMTEAELDTWRASLLAADAADTHFLSSMPVLTLATR